MEIPGRRGWFVIPGKQDGFRTVDSQSKGLAEINFYDKSVLDLGCAEGLITKYALDKGAKYVHGIDNNESFINQARSTISDVGATFWLYDIAAFARLSHRPTLAPDYDVVLALSILHKFKDPLPILDFIGFVAADLVAIRLPSPMLGGTSVQAYWHKKFRLEAQPETSIEPVSGKPEWLGIFRKVHYA